MAGLTLGLDLGSNSIGWSLIDEQAGILLGTGVRVFPEGVDRDQQGGEHSKNEQRRIARGMRRQIARRARRKKALKHILIQAGLLPPAAGLNRSHLDRVAWEDEQFQTATPYTLRGSALGEKLSPYEIGRALVHINQRRGFLSNRKADKARKKEASDMLKEISELGAKMGERTLGEYLANLQAADSHARLRGRHTRREMLLDEFERVWAAQQQHHPTLLTQQLKAQIHGIIFYQRKMYWPASVIGQCELEPHLPRCPRADRRAQRFRLLQEVNNLRVLDHTAAEARPLSENERATLIAYLSSKKERTFDDIRKHLFDEHEGIRFNLERGDRSKLDGTPTDAALAHKDFFGKSWFKLADEQRDRIVSAIIDEDSDRLRYLLSTFDLNPDLCEVLLEKLNLVEGYSSYSLHAIKKLLPHLERGLPLSSQDDQPCALREAGYLMPWEKVPNQAKLLPPPELVTNPLVRQALFEVRKVVNAILRELVYKEGHKLAHLRIELAREVKGTATERSQRSRQMRQRERDRDTIAEKLRAEGIKPTREAIQRGLLWAEQNGVCIYSGRPISPQQLYGGEVEIDHILPYSRSLDNSLANKVVCFRSENTSDGGKGNRTPHEWLAQTQTAKYEQVLQRTDKLPDFGKARKFRQASIELDEFIHRQLNDTAYISRKVVEYVRCLGADVLCTKGQLTFELRRLWGLDKVLRDDGLDLKNREDHRHHAVDAIVIALTDGSRLQQLAHLRRFSNSYDGEDSLPEPWPSFRHNVEDAVNAINVSHRVQRRVSGALHEETIYGKTEIPNVFVYRKPLEALTAGMVEDIRDPVIRALVQQRLREEGLKPEDKKIPAEVWRKPLCMPSGIPIKKVRLLKRDKTIQPIRGGSAHVKPGSLHHLCIFEFTDQKSRTKRDAVFVSMLEAMHRIRDSQPIIQRTHPEIPQAKFVMSLSGGEMLLTNRNGKEELMLFKTAASTQGQIYLVLHTDGRPSSQMAKVAANANTLKARKITVDPLGRMRWAND